MQVMQAAGQNVLAFCEPIKFEAIVGSDMRPLFAILGLLLCLTPPRADELPVII